MTSTKNPTNFSGGNVKWVFVIILIFSLFLTSCDLSPIDINDSRYIDYSKPRFNVTPTIIENKTIPVVVTNITGNQVIDDKDYLIGSFNVQIFGKTKAGKQTVYAAIVDIIDDYDIIAIQEIRDNSGLVVEKLNSIPNMRLKVSERLGRSTSKEQYVFLYSNRVNPGYALQYPDDNDVFEREPYMMSFEIDGYNFVIIQVHIKPDDAEQEIRHLKEVVSWANSRYVLDDIFIMGDLNADGSYFDSFDYLDGEYEVLIDEYYDTNVAKTGCCAYDRILSTQENPNIIEVGVDRFDDETNGDSDLIKAVSDHYAIYMILDKAEI